MKFAGLYAVTPELADWNTLIERVTQALEGGVRYLQYRNKQGLPSSHRSSPQALQQAKQLLALCHAFNAKLIINDDLALALEINADGVHLGREDGDLAEARRALNAAGTEKILGVSCYNQLERAQEAQRCGADYLAFGSFFNSSTKPNAARAPLEILPQAKKGFDLPIVAIGGITLENAPQLIAAGADSLAVISDLFEATDVRAQAQAYGKLFSALNL